jgi:SNF2 family DNA or RNA helicase
MGAGKTGATLTALREMLDEFKITRVLIVAPLLVAERTWPDEIAEWEHTRVLQYSVLTGTPKQREAAARTDREIHIINRENLTWLWTFLRNGKDWPYDCLVIDEASMLKNGRIRTKASVLKSEAERAKATGRTARATKRLTRFGVLAKAQEHCDRVIELTGTPAPKGLQNLWGLAYVADQGQRLGMSRSAFEKRWFDKDQYGFGLEPRPNAEREIVDRMGDLMFSLHPDDYAELPPLVSNVVEVRLPKPVLKEYKRFERSLYSETYDVLAVTSGALAQKLMQFANGSMYRSSENLNAAGEYVTTKETIWVHDEKLDALECIIDEAQGESVLVAYNFKFDLAALKKKYPKAVVLRDDPNAVSNWNKGEIPLLLAHPASAGHGLNLQYGGAISAWYGLTHDLELYQQFNKRLYRPGQTRTVFLHHICALGTADMDILPDLARKDATQGRILDSVVKRIRAVSD